MVDARMGILYVNHCRQLDALPVFRKGIYSSCKSSAICIRRATRLAASDAGDMKVCPHLELAPTHTPLVPAYTTHSKLENQSHIPSAPIATLSQCKSLIPLSPRKCSHSTRCRDSFLPQTSSAPLFPLVSGTHQAIKVPSSNASPANTK